MTDQQDDGQSAPAPVDDETPTEMTSAEPIEPAPAEVAPVLVPLRTADAALARFARNALAEVTPESSIGELLGARDVSDEVVDIEFATTLGGYVGWHWTVSVATLADGEPNVLELELLPFDGALLAPPWVPWADRLADYRIAHPDGAPIVADDDEDLDDDDDDDDDDDESDDAEQDDFEDLDVEALGDGLDDDGLDDDVDDDVLEEAIGDTDEADPEEPAGATVDGADEHPIEQHPED